MEAPPLGAIAAAVVTATCRDRRRRAV